MRRFGASVWLVLVCVICYANSLEGPFVFDDLFSIPDNASIRSWNTAFSPPTGSGATVSGRPVLNATLAVNWALGGASVWGFHVGNILIHALAAVSLFGVVRRILILMGGAWAERAHWAAWWVAALWAVHPLQTGAVSYVIQRAESLAALFYLFTLYGFLRVVGAGSMVARRGWSVGTVLVCACGMGTKETMVSAPLLVGWIDAVYVGGSLRGAWRARWSLYVALFATWMILIWCIGESGFRGGTAAAVPDGTLHWRYLLTQAKAIFLYLGLVIWPHPLVLDRGRVLVNSLAEVWPQMMAVVGLLGGTLWLALRRRRAALPALLFFAVLAPSSSLVPVVSQTIAEHRMYLPLAGVLGSIVVPVIVFGGRWTTALLGVCLLTLGVGTWSRNRDYATVERLWRDTAEKAPANPRAWASLGAVLFQRGESVEAESALDRAWALAPDDPEVLINRGHLYARTGRQNEALAIYARARALYPKNYDAVYNLGVLALESGRAEEAVKCFDAALAVRPQALDARFNLGNAWMALGRPEKAVAELRAVAAVEPERTDVLNNLGLAMVAGGAIEPGLAVLRQALVLTPSSKLVRLSLGLVLIEHQRAAEALEVYSAGLLDYPTDARFRFGVGQAQVALGRTTEAGDNFERAILDMDAKSDPALHAQLHLALAVVRFDQGRAVDAERAARVAAEDPSSAVTAGYYLGASLAQQGRWLESASVLESVRDQAPALAEARNVLGAAYAQNGRWADAKKEFEAALRLNPGFVAARENLAALVREGY